MTPTDPTDSAVDSPAPVRLSRRGFLAGCAIAASTAAAAAYHATLLEPFWLDVEERGAEIAGLSTSLHGLRIAHLTDVHFDNGLPTAYTDEVARRVREEIKPDLVAFTGDLTTHSEPHLDAGAAWLEAFGCPTYVCLGNHDYDPDTSARAGGTTYLATQLEARLKGSKTVTVLRNASAGFEYKGAVLPIAGVEDWYTGLLDAGAATAGLAPGTPRLMLCHNPDAAPMVDPHTESGLILSGHTHGGQIRLPGFGPLIVPLIDRTRAAGSYKLAGGSSLYVSRGIGYLHRVRFLCRPELVVHKLVSPAVMAATRPATTRSTTTRAATDTSPPTEPNAQR